jgi:hypothetical protein
MPNTLAHIAVHGIANAPLGRERFAAFLPWVLLAVVLPDVPWILKRVVTTIAPGVDQHVLELYVSVQASLALSLLLAAAAAAFARRPVIVWAVLAANTLLHLLIDAVEIKPGNAVHLLAPFSWRGVALELVWPEHPLVTAATALGTVFAVAVLLVPRFAPTRGTLAWSVRRAGVAAMLSIAYLALPFWLMSGVYDANYRQLQVLMRPAESVGEYVELDRRPVETRDGEAYVNAYGQTLRLVGDGVPDTGNVSLRGVLAAPDTIRAAELHVNAASFRDAASSAGLLVVGLVWLRVLWGRK